MHWCTDDTGEEGLYRNRVKLVKYKNLKYQREQDYESESNWICKALLEFIRDVRWQRGYLYIFCFVMRP